MISEQLRCKGLTQHQVCVASPEFGVIGCGVSKVQAIPRELAHRTRCVSRHVEATLWTRLTKTVNEKGFRLNARIR